MSMSRIIGLALLVLGIVLLIVGIASSDSVTNQASEALTGRFTDKTVWLFAAGAVGAVVGLALTLFGGSKEAS